MAKEIKKQAETGGSQTVRNMIIAVLTTVVVSTCVYLLGFNKKSSDATKAEKKKATMEAWKALVTSENLAYRNGMSVMIDAGQFETYHEMFQEVLNESLKFQSTLEQLIKKEDVDKDLVTLLKRRLDSEKKVIPLSEKMFAGMDRLLDTALNMDWDEKQFNAALGARLIEYGNENRRMLQRMLTEIEELAGTLAKRYDTPFSMYDFYMVQQDRKTRDIIDILNEAPVDSSASLATRQYLIGKWQPKFAKTTLYFNADGKYRWEIPGVPEEKNAKGDWQISNKQLILTYKPLPDSTGKAAKEGKWIFDLSRVTPHSTNIQFTKEPYNFYTLIRL